MIDFNEKLEVKILSDENWIEVFDCYPNKDHYSLWFYDGEDRTVVSGYEDGYIKASGGLIYGRVRNKE